MKILKLPLSLHRLDYTDTHFVIRDSNGVGVIEVPFPDREEDQSERQFKRARAVAIRIVDCLNACECIRNDLLERVVYQGLKTLKKERPR